ncbi:hypothetical protein [Flavobacterium sp. J27]|uniref:hypothetical protein n=1 Tax=Flavobacterium sp. J27 TaxID=2060419 RepID=UPI001030E674|nr:hypothetical protein [Flavobacterium sp. J27]
MKKTISILIIQIILIPNLYSQEKTEIDLIKENTFYFEINENNASGAGFDLLKKEIEKAQFVILGEEHFSAKISEFTNSIVPTLTANNFKYFAAEIGPNSADEISRLIQNQKSLYPFNTKINNLVGDVPVPFFDGKEDEVFLKSFLKNDFKIWGLDQEYLTSPIFLMDRLFELSNRSEKIEPYYLIAKEFVISEIKKGRQNQKYKVFTSLLNSSEVNHYLKKLDQSNKEINKIIVDLKKSSEVYKLREDNNLYESIHKRLYLMQENFIDYYNAALLTDSLPKVFLKIGGVHASKGKSLHNIYDIGNFMMEIANYNKRKSVHLLIFPSAYLNDDGTISKNIDKEDEDLFNPIIDFNSNKYTIIDLKSIEKSSWKHKIEGKSLKDYMYRFDYLILTPASRQTELNYKN